VAAEAWQLFSTDRYPSATDVTAALLGTALGAIGFGLVSKISV
jgi:hypothetical protein